MPLQPLVLSGSHVRLEPLVENHVSQLCECGLDAGLWQWSPTALSSSDDMADYVRIALQMQRDGTALPFVIIERSSGRIIGSTRFANYDVSHRRVEIGWTWIAPLWQRTAINTGTKYLLLKHAFEALGCLRVELKTDVLNLKSRAAILRIGAQEEGILRNHMVTHTGRVRDTVYYSIIDSEWPAVKSSLEEKLRRLPKP
jgi:RimJ/RimL family protein N-acetyltransferase